MNNNKISKPKPRTINLKQKIPVFVPENVVDQIRYLCSTISNVEWSGVLFYDTVGDIDDPDFEITLRHIYLMHKGTGGATNYEFNEELVKHVMDNPSLKQCRIGHIHSHHNMSAYLSVTDMDELTENSEFHNFYLSIVVNNRMEITGKIGFRGKADVFECKNKDGDPYKLKVEFNNEVMFVYELDIKKAIPDIISIDFIDRLVEVEKKAEEQQKKMEQQRKKNLPIHQPVAKDNMNISNAMVKDLTDHLDESFTSYFIMDGSPGSEAYDVSDAIDIIESSFRTGLLFRNDMYDHINTIIGNAPALFSNYYMGEDEDIVEVFQTVISEIEEWSQQYRLAELLIPSLTKFVESIEIVDTKKVKNGRSK